MLLLDSSVWEGHVVAFYYRAKVSDWMPQETGLTGDGTMQATTRPAPDVVVVVLLLAVCDFGQGLSDEE
jgi:hypothetical protein